MLIINTGHYGAKRASYLKKSYRALLKNWVSHNQDLLEDETAAIAEFVEVICQPRYEEEMKAALTHLFTNELHKIICQKHERIITSKPDLQGMIEFKKAKDFFDKHFPNGFTCSGKELIEMGDAWAKIGREVGPDQMVHVTMEGNDVKYEVVS